MIIYCMLSQLSIENFGLIEKVSIDFSQSLNILTGSTGAGKSIIIEGLRFALGERIKPSQIRDNKKPCIIEAVFELNDAILKEKEDFRDFITDEESILIINRQLLPDGRSKIKINGFSVTVAQLKTLGNNLIDLHGPHDHQMLFSEESHIDFLDQLVDFGNEQKKYQKIFQDYVILQTQLKDLRNMSHSKDRDLDLLEHQIKELSQVTLEKDAYEKTCQDQSRISNAEKLHECGASLMQLFENTETGISEVIHETFGSMKTLNQIDDKTLKLEEYLTNIQENSDQLIVELRDYLDSLSFEPEEAREINQKYDIYEDIKRKYGPTVKEANEFFTQAKSKYNLLNDMEHNDAELKKEIHKKEIVLKKLAKGLTLVREKTARELRKTIEKELKDLGIENVTFEARISTIDFNARGQDKVVFYISPNAGEELKPLAEIVSSGEAARVMLALKKALTKVDPIPVLIFDEIDAQIGGRLGTVIGTKLKELSKDRQVILITHLPQIASFAESHFKVTKKIVESRTITRVNLLDSKARIQELSEMMSGGKKSTISVSHAEDMLANAKSF